MGLPRLPTIRSARPSRLKSPVASASGALPVAMIDCGAKVPLPRPSKIEDVVAALIGRSQVEDAVAIEVGDGQRGGVGTDRHRAGRLERAITPAHQDRDIVRELVDGDQVEDAVAIQIGRVDDCRTGADRDRLGGLEGPVTRVDIDQDLAAVIVGRGQVGLAIAVEVPVSDRRRARPSREFGQEGGRPHEPGGDGVRTQADTVLPLHTQVVGPGGQVLIDPVIGVGRRTGLTRDDRLLVLVEERDARVEPHAVDVHGEQPVLIQRELIDAAIDDRIQHADDRGRGIR